MHSVFSQEKKFFNTALFILVAGIAIHSGIMLYTEPASAGLMESGTGFAWGGGAATNGPGYDGIGWLSFNNLSDGSLSSYGVNVPLSDGALSGYAWSEHYGWLSFNGSDLGDCTPALAPAARTGSSISGGARILSIRDAGLNSGGWSGCVSLSGLASDSSPYGVTIAGTALSGYAWSDELGWIDMSGVTLQTPTTLKICQDSCASSILRGSGGATSSFALSQGSSQNLVACFNTASGCSDPSGDVTAATLWNETNAPIDAFSLAPVAGAQRLTGNTPGWETFSAGYGSVTATMNASVICSPTVSCTASPNRDQVCTGDTYVIADDGCGNEITCPGARYCDFNWREVAP